jgi:YcaO-like protein with predicted kinase domain
MHPKLRTMLRREGPPNERLGTVRGAERPSNKLPGTSRTRSAADTLSLLTPLTARFGITRLANVTGLDVVGLPVWQAVRPNARSLSVAQGKGVDHVSAKVSALMESLEAYHAEHARCPVRVESRRALSREARVIDAARLPRSNIGHFHDDLPLPWARGEHLTTGEVLYVPFELVHSNFTVPRVPASGVFVGSSNGLGAGNHGAEAALHGLCELVERDAETLFSIGGARAKTQARVSLDTVDGPGARALIARLRDAGLEVMIWDMTSDVALPAFSTVIFDLASDPLLNPRPAAEGSGCHFDRDVALCRALSEAAQARLTSIAGSRDDLTAARYDAFQSEASLSYWRAQVSSPATRSFAEAPHQAGAATVDEDLAHVVERLAERGVDEIAVVDVSSPGVPLSFVRVVAAGLEGSMASPSFTPGERALARLAE